MNNQTIFLVYRTDRWLGKDSEELVYVSTDLLDAVAQLEKYRSMTKEQAEEVLAFRQSQLNGLDYEWIAREVQLNTFTD